MTKTTNSKRLKQGEFCKTVRKRYKRRFKKTCKAKDSELMKVVNDWLESVINRVVKGEKVMFDKHSYMRVVGVPMLEHSTFGLRKAGKCLAGKFIKKADNMNRRRGDFVFKIEYVNSKSKEKIYFNAHPNFSRRVRESLINTNTFYPIVSNEHK